MGEYDIYSKNPFYKSSLLISVKHSNLDTIKSNNYNFCKSFNSLKTDSLQPGPLYEIHIQDGNSFFTIKVSLVTCNNNKLCTEYDMVLNQNYKVRINHTINSFSTISSYGGSTSCPSGAPFGLPTTDQSPDPNNCTKVFNIQLKNKINCIGGSPCPPDWEYCEDVVTTTKRIYGTTFLDPMITLGNSKKFGCPIKGYKVSEDEVKIISRTIGRSRQSCIEDLINKNPDVTFIGHRRDMSHWAAVNGSTYLCFEKTATTNSYRYNNDLLSFNINIYNNLLEIVLPKTQPNSGWPNYTSDRNKFYINRTNNSLFPIIKAYVKNPNISIKSIFNTINNKNRCLGDIILKND
jgi:hypothetical protein